MSLGAGLVAPAAFAPPAHASCWSNHCKAYVSNKNVNQGVRQYAPWGYVVSPSIRAHYSDCTQLHTISPYGLYSEYIPQYGYPCAWSAVLNTKSYTTHNDYSIAQATAWKRTAGCTDMWARELGDFSAQLGGWKETTC